MITLSATNLRKQYTHRTLFSELSFEHHEGTLGIAGSNGSGKSTLLRCLAYLQGIDRGRIQWTLHGKEVQRAELRAQMGFVAPNIHLYDELSVLENLEFIEELNIREHSNKVSADEWLERCQVAELKDYPYQRLSTGQQQRVKLAIALSRTPSVLFLDEPGANLDAAGKQLIKEVMEEIKQQQTLLLLATNDPKELDLCDHIIHLSR